MLLPNTSKGIFLLINHLLATFIPHHLDNVAHLKGPVSSVTPIPHLGLEVNFQSASLLHRGDSCSCRSKCPRKKIFNPKESRKCVWCPPVTKLDPIHKICIKGTSDKSDDEEEKKKKEAKYQKYKERKEKMKQKFKDSAKECKENKYKKKKEAKAKEFKDDGTERKKRSDKKKARRLGRGIPLVGLLLGTTAVAYFANEFFDEDYLESDTLAELWPMDLIIEPWESEESDKIFTYEAFVQQYVKFANEHPPYVDENLPSKELSQGLGNRSLEIAELHSNITSLAIRGLEQTSTLQSPPADTSLSFEQNRVEERFLQALIPVFLAALDTAAVVGRIVIRVFTRYTASIAKQGKKGENVTKQHETAKWIAKDKN